MNPLARRSGSACGSTRPTAFATTLRILARIASGSLLVVAASTQAPAPRAAAQGSWPMTIYTTVPAVNAVDTTYELRVDTFGGLSMNTGLSGGAFAAAGTPPFLVPTQYVASNAAAWGGHQRVVATLEDPSGNSGSSVRIDANAFHLLDPALPANALPGRIYYDKWFTPIHNATVTLIVAPGKISKNPGGTPRITIGNPSEDEVGLAHVGSQTKLVQAYRLDSVAQAAVAAHFGSMTLDVEMIRNLGEGILGMGFPGQISVFPFGAAAMAPGESLEYAFGPGPVAPDELVFVQVLSTFDNPVGDMSTETDERWFTLGSQWLVPEPASGTLLAIAALAALGLRRGNLTNAAPGDDRSLAASDDP
ncbi:MAG: hypothetical protein KF688_10650 [Pirellulales bacterium]|nr:hypothetical protein [Pirellulales bacterium]